MPPPDSNKRLTTSQRELLKQWVAEGAPYQKHWSFVTPEKLPGVDAGNPIDHFIGKRLRRAGLKFSPQADLRTLIRAGHVGFDRNAANAPRSRSVSWPMQEFAAKRLLTKRLSIGYSPHKPMANAWPWRGWMRPVTATPV